MGAYALTCSCRQSKTGGERLGLELPCGYTRDTRRLQSRGEEKSPSAWACGRRREAG
jgi:hypothetical protein